MADEQIRIDVTAEDDASRVIEQVADDAEALEKLSPEIPVTADTDAATRALGDVADDAAALSRQDTEIVLRAKIDDAKAALKTLRGDLDQTGEKADATARQLDRVGSDSGGMRTRGNAIADLTGPLGEASSAASDFAGVFDGIGDIAEDVAGKVGLNAAAMSTAIGGIGIAVAAGAAAWSYFQERQRKAREEQAKLVEGQRKLNDAIREGNTADAASQLVEDYRAAFDAADRLGVSVREVTEYLTGQSDSLPTWDARLRELVTTANDAATANADNAQAARDAWQAYADGVKPITDAKDQYRETNGTLKEQDDRLRNVAAGLGGLVSSTDRATRASERHERQVQRNRDALDRLRGGLNMDQAFAGFERAMSDAMTAAEGEAQTTADEILAIKQSIFDVAEYAKLTPIQVASLLRKVENGDLAGVAADVENYYRAHKVGISTQLNDPSSFDVAEYRRRLTAAIGEVPVRGRLTTVRSGNTQIPV